MKGDNYFQKSLYEYNNNNTNNIGSNKLESFTRLPKASAVGENNIPNLKYNQTNPPRQFGKDITRYINGGQQYNQQKLSYLSNKNKTTLNLKDSNTEKENIKPKIAKIEKPFYHLRPRTTSSNDVKSSLFYSGSHSNFNYSARMVTVNQANRALHKLNKVTEIIHEDENIEMKTSFLIDSEDCPDPQKVTEYIDDIFEYLKSVETCNQPKYYMHSQVDINEEMRSILIDWLVDVHLKFKLLPETLFLTVGIIDRFLEKTEITRNQLQLVGVTALFIACKYEEIYPPEIKDYVYVTDKAYNKKEILCMEKNILNALKFEVTLPSSLLFLDTYIELSGVKFDEQYYLFARYLLELSLIQYKMILYKPSLAAAAAVYLSYKVVNAPVHDVDRINILFISGYSEEKIKECARYFLLMLYEVQNSQFEAVKNKYSSMKYLEVACFNKK